MSQNLFDNFVCTEPTLPIFSTKLLRTMKTILDECFKCFVFLTDMHVYFDSDANYRFIV